MKRIIISLFTLFSVLIATTVFAAAIPSNTVDFTVTSSSPTISSISPSSAEAGGFGFNVTVNGDNFISGSQVQFNSSNKNTTFISSTQLIAQISNSDIVSVGSFNVRVLNPGSEGGISNTMIFEVTEAFILEEEVPPEVENEPLMPFEITDTLDDVAEFIEDLSKKLTENITQIGPLQNYLKEIVKTPTGSVITKIITTSGVAVAASAAVFLPSFAFLEILLTPIRLWGLILTFLGIRKKNLPWGVVYDSVTKQPLDPSYVMLKNINGKEVASAITDIDGRYGFLMPPGIYYIEAKKTNYNFPSKKLNGVGDEVYNNLYFGEKIEVVQGQLIKKNIPLDPVKFDWNEFAKRNKNFMKFYSKWDIIIRKISNASFIIGFFVAALVLFIAPYPYNIIVFSLYVAFLLFKILMRLLGLQPKSLGSITEKKTGIPLSFAIIRVMSPSTHTEISNKVADKYGRYYCLVPRGKYYVKIEKKNPDESYSPAYTSGIIDVSRKGIIKETFKV